MNECIYSTNINRFTTIDKKEMQQMKEYYQIEFDKNIDTFLDNIDLDCSDVCLDCNNRITRREAIV